MGSGRAARYNNSLAAQGDQPLGAVLGSSRCHFGTHRYASVSVSSGKEPNLPSCWIPEKFNLLLHSSSLLCLCHILSMRFWFSYCHSIPFYSDSSLV